MRHLTPRLAKTFLFAFFLLTAAIAQPSTATCPDLSPLTIDSPTLLFGDSSSLMIERRLDLPTQGVLILEAQDLSTKDQIAWIDIQPINCGATNQRSILRPIERTVSRRIVDVGAGSYLVRMGWLDPSAKVEALEVRGQFFASRTSLRGAIVAFDGEEGEGDDGNGTGEADNEILPHAPINLVTLDGEEGEGDDGNGTGEADNEILPLAPISLVTLDGGRVLVAQAATEVVSTVQPDSTEHWLFELQSPVLVRLIAISDGPTRWSLSDETGQRVVRGRSDLGRDQDRYLALPSGRYLLTVRSSNDRPISYGLRLDQHTMK